MNGDDSWELYLSSSLESDIHFVNSIKFPKSNDFSDLVKYSNIRKQVNILKDSRTVNDDCPDSSLRPIDNLFVCKDDFLRKTFDNRFNAFRRSVNSYDVISEKIFLSFQKELDFLSSVSHHIPLMSGFDNSKYQINQHLYNKISSPKINSFFNSRRKLILAGVGLLVAGLISGSLLFSKNNSYFTTIDSSYYESSKVPLNDKFDQLTVDKNILSLYEKNIFYDLLNENTATNLGYSRAGSNRLSNLLYGDKYEIK